MAIDRGLPAEEICDLTKIDPWFIQQIEEIAAMNRRAGQRHGRNRLARSAARSQAQRRQRRAPGANLEDHARRGPPAARALWRRAGLQTRGHLRRRIRILHAVHVLHLRRRRRSRAAHRPQDNDPRQRPKPHRAGNRVRLLLLPRFVRAARRRLRNHHGELQSRRRSPPITTPPTASTSSRSRSKTFSPSSNAKSRRA